MFPITSGTSKGKGGSSTGTSESGKGESKDAAKDGGSSTGTSDSGKGESKDAAKDGRTVHSAILYKTDHQCSSVYFQ